MLIHTVKGISKMTLEAKVIKLLRKLGGIPVSAYVIYKLVDSSMGQVGPILVSLVETGEVVHHTENGPEYSVGLPLFHMKHALLAEASSKYIESTVPESALTEAMRV